jgi:hypothetical protein
MKNILLLLALSTVALGQTSARYSPEFVKAARRALPLFRVVSATPMLELHRVLRMADAEAEVYTQADQAVFWYMKELADGKFSPIGAVTCVHQLMIILRDGQSAADLKECEVVNALRPKSPTELPTIPDHIE